MKSIFGMPLTACVPTRLKLLPVLQTLVEKGCDLFGMHRQQALKLAMAGEEVFAHVCSVQTRGLITVTLTPRATGATLSLHFSRSNIDLSGMNLSASPAILMDENAENLDNLGLLLASRMVDGFSLSQEKDTISVTLQQDSDYPTKGAVAKKAAGQARGDICIASASDSATIIDSCQRARALYPLRFIPDDFDTPGKIADQIMFDEFFAARAVDTTGATCGILYWKILSEKCVGFYGPYIFVEPSAHTARLLMEKMLSQITGTPARSLLGILATDDLPQEFMEHRVQITYRNPSKEKTSQSLWYRRLGNDETSFVCSHPEMIPFLETAYKDLRLSRDIHQVSSLGEKQHTHSVLSVSLEKNLNKAMLTPMIDGMDMEENIHAHLQNLRQEGIHNIFFHLEMALAWQAHIARILLQSDFKPVCVLPHAGSSDILVFQYMPSTT